MASKRSSKREAGVHFGHIYLRDVRFSHRSDALNLVATTPVALDRIKLKAVVSERPDRKVAVLTLRVWTDPKDPGTPYHFSVEMVATVSDGKGKSLPLAEFLKAAGTSTLYPFIREIVANLTMRGRFGPVWLKPLNVGILAQHWRGQSPFVAAESRSDLAREKASKKTKGKLPK